jgi:hypothetical protein
LKHGVCASALVRTLCIHPVHTTTHFTTHFTTHYTTHFTTHYTTHTTLHTLYATLQVMGGEQAAMVLEIVASAKKPNLPQDVKDALRETGA